YGAGMNAQSLTIGNYMRTFILGLGAQKAGTTWVYTQLAKLPEFKAPNTKEMHIFDAVHLEECVWFRRKVEKDFSAALLKGRRHYEKTFVTKRMQMMLNQDEYFSYYDRLMDADHCVSADVTPTYSGLPVEVLGYIRAKFEKLSIRTRVVFLMREPVARLESAIRMRLRKTSKIEDISLEHMMGEMKTHAHSKQDRVRSSYRDTVSRIRACFSDDEIHLGFYETMFQADELDRLGAFLGIDVSGFDTGERVNHTSKSFAYPMDFLLDLKESYADNYAFATQDLSLEPEIWDRALSKLSA
ncbi:MAG: sulfotransferase domain-containing protein, partial [Pseudomonadota bacterium]